MSILLECNQGWIISHPLFFDHIQVKCEGLSVSESSLIYKLNPNLFDIKSKFIKSKPNQNKSLSELINENDSKNISTKQSVIEMNFNEIIVIGQRSGLFTKIDETADDSTDYGGNRTARKTAAEFYEALTLDFVREEIKFNGANATEDAVISEISGRSFIFPKQTVFYCGNIQDILQKDLNQLKFDFIIMDPPWKNKYIWRNNKRRKTEGGGYKLVENLQIENLPIEDICNDRALVAVWCTNAMAHQEDLTQNMFSRWSITHLTTWYWVKVTKSGEQVCPFNVDNKKQPYEAIIIGQYTPSYSIQQEKLAAPSSLSSSKPSNIPIDIHPDLKSTKIIVSVPSSLHSHKPPLIEIFRKYLYPAPKCCELFARYLVPGFTSVGNEVVKLQHKSLYVDG